MHIKVVSGLFKLVTAAISAPRGTSEQKELIKQILHVENEAQENEQDIEMLNTLVKEQGEAIAVLKAQVSALNNTKNFWSKSN